MIVCCHGHAINMARRFRKMTAMRARWADNTLAQAASATTL
ncbi:MAG: hypothetical protein Q8O07_09275 [Chloroflexota bacterium]|nr:hypothetical protein [Chloroflexota bacterium]